MNHVTHSVPLLTGPDYNALILFLCCRMYPITPAWSCLFATLRALVPMLVGSMYMPGLRCATGTLASVFLC